MSTETEEPPLRIAIVGGGIGGLVMCIGLELAKERGKHIDVKLYEAAGTFAEIGAGVSFGPNATDALNCLGLGKEYSSLTDEGDPNQKEFTWFDWRYGEKGFDGDKGYIATVFGPGSEKHSVHRADFLDLLVSKLPPSVANFSKRLLSLDYTKKLGKGQETEITLKFADGTTATTDLVVGCDGIKSSVRKSMVLIQRGLDPEGTEPEEISPKFTGTCAYRGLIPMERMSQIMSVDQLPIPLDRRAAQAAGDISSVKTQGIERGPVMWLGKDKHVLHFPIRKKTLANVVVFVSDRSTPTPQWSGREWVEKIDQKEMLAQFEGWDERVMGILREIKEPTRWAIHELPELETFVNWREADSGKRVGIALVGDAAHGMLPHQGAGAGQAVEDALVLASLLAHPLSSLSNLSALLTVYDEFRRPRSQKCARTSRLGGEVYQLVAPGIGSDRQKLKEELESRIKWLWEWDGAGEVKKAEIDFEKKVHSAHV